MRKNHLFLCGLCEIWVCESKLWGLFGKEVLCLSRIKQNSVSRVLKKQRSGTPDLVPAVAVASSIILLSELTYGLLIIQTLEKSSELHTSAKVWAFLLYFISVLCWLFPLFPPFKTEVDVNLSQQRSNYSIVHFTGHNSRALLSSFKTLYHQLLLF